MNALGINANNPAAQQERWETLRDFAYNLRHKMQRLADYTKVEKFKDGVSKGFFPKHKRFIACGSWSMFEDKHVEVTLRDGVWKKAGYRGLQTCGSVWACFPCARKVQHRRADEIYTALKWGKDVGQTIAMITLTAAHKQSDPLVQNINYETGEVKMGVWDAITAGWQNAMYSRGYRADKEMFQLGHYIRVTEVTYGANGWHVHLHILFFIDAPKQVARHHAFLFGERLFTRWQAGLRSVGFDAIKESGGLDVSIAEQAEKSLSEYLSRSKLEESQQIVDSYYSRSKGLSAEAALSVYKDGRKTSRTPFQILADIDEKNPGQDFAKWREFVDGSKGKRQITWSRGLRDQVKLAEEKTDKEIAEEDLGDPTVLVLSSDEWKRIKYQSQDLLKLIEKEGPESAQEYLYSVAPG